MAFVFIVAAHIMVLALAIVPHHHHNDQVCFVISHCHSHHGDSHDAPDGRHHHDDNQESETCVLKKAYLAASGEVAFNVQVTNLFGHDPNDVQALITGMLFSEASAFSLLKQTEFYTSFFCPDVIRTSHGLRAPPLV